MDVSNQRALRVAARNTLGVFALVTLTAAAAADDFGNADVQFMLASEPGQETVTGCSDALPCGAAVDPLADCGYCWDGPCFTDRLTTCFAAKAKSLAERGVVYDPSVTQFYQGVASGGNEQTFEYGGKVDQFLILDSCKLGLWHGMKMVMHAETRFGDDVNSEAVTLAPVNVAMLYPNTFEHDTAITGLTFVQSAGDDWQITFGKFNALDMFYELYPQTGRGVETFMNASIALPLAVARVVPLSFMGAGINKLKDGKPQAGLLVYDTHNVPTTSGFDELFDNGVNIMAYYRKYTKYRGLPGSHYFAGIASTGEFFAADPAGFVIVPGQGLVTAPRQDGSWAAIYILEQTMWADSCRPTRNVSLLSAWSIADEETCPFGWTGNVTVQFHGMNCARPHDTLGVGYFYTGLSNDFQTLLNPVLDLGDVHGGEVFYNMAVSKCCQLTADLQVIEPAENANDTAVVVGLRAMIGF